MGMDNVPEFYDKIHAREAVQSLTEKVCQVVNQASNTPEISSKNAPRPSFVRLEIAVAYLEIGAKILSEIVEESSLR